MSSAASIKSAGANCQQIWFGAEVLGFLGPNGVGKSTTMRMITGFIPPGEGEVAVAGFDVVEQPFRAKRLNGYLPESARPYPR